MHLLIGFALYSGYEMMIFLVPKLRFGTHLSPQLRCPHPAPRARAVQRQGSQFARFQRRRRAMSIEPDNKNVQAP